MCVSVKQERKSRHSDVQLGGNVRYIGDGMRGMSISSSIEQDTWDGSLMAKGNTCRAHLLPIDIALSLSNPSFGFQLVQFRFEFDYW